jgi:hypothetical protein
LDHLLASLKEMQRQGFTVTTSKMGEVGIQGRAGSPVFLEILADRKVTSWGEPLLLAISGSALAAKLFGSVGFASYCVFVSCASFAALSENLKTKRILREQIVNKLRAP